MRHIWPWKLLAIWVKDGWVMWAESWWQQQTRLPCKVWLCALAPSCYRPSRTGEKQVPTCWGLHCASLCPPSGYCEKQEEDAPELTPAPVPHYLGPQGARRVHQLPSLSEEHGVHPYVLRKAASVRFLTLWQKYLRKSTCKKEIFILAHSFKDFSPWLLGSVAS